MNVTTDADYFAKLLRGCRHCHGKGSIFVDSSQPDRPCGVCGPGRELLKQLGYEPKTTTVNGRRAPNPASRRALPQND